jgi:hypothetical protein
MGTSGYKKQGILHSVEEFMSDFYFRLIDHEFIKARIKEIKSKQNICYSDYWELTKKIGIHTSLAKQTEFWESAFINYSDISIDGILFIFLLLCKGTTESKLREIKTYLWTYIVHSKEPQDDKLILNLEQFKSIFFVFFATLTHIAINTIFMAKEGDEQNDQRIKEIFNEANIDDFVDKLMLKYSKKQFFINAGKFLDDNIELLTKDSLVREAVYNVYVNIKISTIEADEKVNILSDGNKEPVDIDDSIKKIKKQKRFFNCNFCKKKKQKTREEIEEEAIKQRELKLFN